MLALGRDPLVLRRDLLWRGVGTDEVDHRGVDHDGEVGKRPFVQLIGLRDGVVGLDSPEGQAQPRISTYHRWREPFIDGTLSSGDARERRGSEWSDGKVAPIGIDDGSVGRSDQCCGGAIDQAVKDQLH